MKSIILNCIDDLVSKLLYYDRKDDEDLPLGEIEKALKNKEITVDEIVEKFKSTLKSNLK